VRIQAIFAAAALTLVAIGACSSPTSASRPCNENPFNCAAGTTCWLDGSKSYACLPVGSAKKGDACSPALGPQAPCGEGLICLATGASGVCTPYCDDAIPGRACAGGEKCLPAQVLERDAKTGQLVSVGGRISVCATGGTPVADAGAAADAKAD
jgi:hypothetical protein